MREFFKGRTWLQWASFGATVLLLILGILSAFIPELAAIGQNFEAYLITLGVVVAPGILTKGKAVGQAVKNLLPAKERRKIERDIRGFKKKLDDIAEYYSEVIRVAEDIKALGGALTPEQQIKYDTYITQKNAIETKIAEEQRRLEVPE